MPSVRLDWTEGAPDQAGQGFRVYRSVNGGPWTLVAVLPLSTTTYTDTNVVEGSYYWYRVVEYYGSQESPPAEIHVYLGLLYSERVPLADASPRSLARAYTEGIAPTETEFTYRRGKQFLESLPLAEELGPKDLRRALEEPVGLEAAPNVALSRPPFTEELGLADAYPRLLERYVKERLNLAEEFIPILNVILQRRLKALSTFNLEEIAEVLQKVRFEFKRLIGDYYDAEGNIQRSLFHYDRGKPRIAAFLEPAAVEFERLGAALIALYDQLFLETASGPALDAIGARWGLRRAEGQPDQEFRERIRLEIQICLSSGTTDQIKDIVCRWFSWPPGIVEINRNYSKLLNMARDAFYEIRLPLSLLIDPNDPKWFRFAQTEELVLQSERGFDFGRFKYPLDLWNWRLVYELDTLLDRITAAGVEWLIATFGGFRFSLDPLAPTENSDRGFDRGKLVGGVFGRLFKA
ncbi:MAG: fibronectin type III domain-containing protein [Thermofilaceae archaeon]